MPRFLLAIPAYRCAPQIPRTLQGLTPELMERIEEGIVIDNQSPDGTVAAAQAAIQELDLGNKVRVMRNRANYGLGGTHKAAFLYAEQHGFDYVLILHGDNQARTEELNTIIDAVMQNPEADAVLGSRFMKGSRLDNYSPTRIWGNKGLNGLYTLLSGRHIQDLGSGLNAFKVASLKTHAFLQASDRMTFNMDLLVSYFIQRAKLVFVPITWSESDQVSNAHNIEVGKNALKAVVAWRLGRPILHHPRLDGYAFDTVDA